MQKTDKSILKNTDAYIPFPVIGIFIVLEATFTSVYFVKIDYEIAQTIYDTDLINPKQTAANLAAADFSRYFNYTGMKPLKWQDEHPIGQMCRRKLQRMGLSHIPTPPHASTGRLSLT